MELVDVHYDYSFHRLELRHCIAYAKAVQEIIKSCLDNDFMHDAGLLISHRGKVKSDHYDDEDIDIGFSDSAPQRVGSLGTIHSHCISWCKGESILRLDGYRDVVKYDISTTQNYEEEFFQQGLIQNPNNLLYIISFEYLYNNFDLCENFQIESNIMSLITNFPEFTVNMKNDGYFDDLIDLYNMVFDFKVNPNLNIEKYNEK